MFIVYAPDKLIIIPPSKSTSRNQIKILKARTNEQIITNKIKLFMNLNWDDEFCDDDGGVRLKKMAHWLKTPVIWVAYLVDSHASPETNEKIRTMLIDFGKNAIFKDSKLKKTVEILFDEVNF